MKLLLDTHTFLWSVLEVSKLSETARSALADPANQVFVSSVTFWEIALKASLGKLTLQGCTPESLIDAAAVQGFELLSLDPASAASSANLPRRADHRDPFDRMLIWQALRGDMVLVSRDERIRASEELRVLW